MKKQAQISLEEHIVYGVALRTARNHLLNVGVAFRNTRGLRKRGTKLLALVDEIDRARSDGENLMFSESVDKLDDNWLHVYYGPFNGDEK